MIWLRAIWINVKKCLEDSLAAILISAILVGMFLAIGTVLYSICWVVNHFFGATGVLWMFGIVAVTLIVALVVEMVKTVYRAVKETKEALERDAIELD